MVAVKCHDVRINYNIHYGDDKIMLKRTEPDNTTTVTYVQLYG